MPSTSQHKAPQGPRLTDRPASPYLMRSSRKTDPTVIQGHNKLPSLKLHAHLASPKQDQWVHGHHTAVSNEHPTSFDLFVVHQVGAVKVSDLEQKTSDDDTVSRGGDSPLHRLQHHLSANDSPSSLQPVPVPPPRPGFHVRLPSWRLTLGS